MRLWLVFILAGVLAMLNGCDRADGVHTPGETGRLRIVATVGMVADVVRNVAGERAEVVGLIGTGVDPHLYLPSRDDVAQLARADVVFYSGLHLEGKLTDVLVRTGRTRPVHALAEAVPAERRLAEGGEIDPHVWMDASLWAEAARAAGRLLAEHDPARAAEYAQRAEAYAAELMALHAYGQQVIASVPPQQRVLITSHDAFRYFGRAYGLEVMGVQGLSTESEAGLRDINRLVDLIVERGVTAVFVESSVPRKSVEALIEGAGRRGHRVAIGGELFSDAMGAEGTYEGTYLGMIDHNLTVVARALGGEAPERGFRGKLTPR